MWSLAEAQQKVLALARALPTETVAVEDCAGRVLAEDVIAAADLPPFSASMMDGYAVGESSTRLPVVGESRAGSLPGTLAAGTAMRIFTGAPLPQGADRVVPQERVVVDGEIVSLEALPRAGAFVRQAGADLRVGSLVLRRGTPLSAAQAGLLAMLDHAEVEVARRPIVTVVSTGDEVRAAGQARAGTVPDASGVAVRALLRQAGADVRPAVLVRDSQPAIEAALREALACSDVVVTIGGVSVGDHDRVRPALAAVGVTLAFWQVALKPGKPLAVGSDGRVVVLALPGNPTSALVTLALFGLPLLRRMSGRLDALPRPSLATLAEAVTHDTGRLELVRAQLAFAAGRTTATVLANQASGALTSLAAADALLLLPAEVATLPSGATVEVYRWTELCA